MNVKQPFTRMQREPAGGGDDEEEEERASTSSRCASASASSCRRRDGTRRPPSAVFVDRDRAGHRRGDHDAAHVRGASEAPRAAQHDRAHADESEPATRRRQPDAQRLQPDHAAREPGGARHRAAADGPVLRRPVADPQVEGQDPRIDGHRGGPRLRRRQHAREATPDHGRRQHGHDDRGLVRREAGLRHRHARAAEPPRGTLRRRGRDDQRRHHGARGPRQGRDGPPERGARRVPEAPRRGRARGPRPPPSSTPTSPGAARSSTT